MTDESAKSETVFWFGKWKGRDLTEVPGGYLRWCVDNFDPVPLPKDTRGLSAEEIKAMEDRMRSFLKAAENELDRREHHDQD